MQADLGKLPSSSCTSNNPRNLTEAQWFFGRSRAALSVQLGVPGGRCIRLFGAPLDVQRKLNLVLMITLPSRHDTTRPDPSTRTRDAIPYSHFVISFSIGEYLLAVESAHSGVHGTSPPAHSNFRNLGLQFHPAEVRGPFSMDTTLVMAQPRDLALQSANTEDTPQFCVHAVSFYLGNRCGSRIALTKTGALRSRWNYERGRCRSQTDSHWCRRTLLRDDYTALHRW